MNDLFGVRCWDWLIIPVNIVNIVSILILYGMVTSSRKRVIHDYPFCKILINYKSFMQVML